MLHTYVEEKRARLPEGVSLDIWSDITYYLKGRLGMMVKNLAMGALLVFIVLALFLGSAVLAGGTYMG